MVVVLNQMTQVIMKNLTYQLILLVIVKKMIKYYWNQTYFFHLDQSPNKKKIPILV